MTSDDQQPHPAQAGATNPYAAPVESSPIDVTADLPPEELRRVKAVVKDANQVVLAVLLCIFCSALGGVIIPIWYSVRLTQWSGLARRHPQLLDGQVPRESLAAKFQSSKGKLIAGAVIGVVLLALCGGSFLMNFLLFDGPPAPPVPQR